MNLAVKNICIRESTIIWAVIASILLHMLLMIIVPNVKFDEIKIPNVLEIELKKPEPPAIVPEPPKPIEPPKPEPIKEVKPKITPKPIIKPIEAPSKIEQEAPPPPSPVDKVIAIEPVIESKPEVIAPTPIEIPEPPPQVDMDSALNEYGGLLGRAIAKHKQYPKIAQMRGWQGDVIVDLKLNGDGNVLSAKVHESSGHEALDKQALEMVKKASPFPTPPEALRGRTFNITVPVSFKLETA